MNENDDEDSHSVNSSQSMTWVSVSVSLCVFFVTTRPVQWVEKMHNWHNYVFQCIFSSGCRTGMLYSYPMLTHLLQVHSWAPTNEINCSPHHFTPPYSFCLKHFFHYLILALDRNRIRRWRSNPNKFFDSDYWL